MSSFRTRSAIVVGLIAAASLGLAACGGDDDAGDSASATTSGGGTASAGGVSVQTIDGTDVLVDSDGRVLYSAGEEKDGEVLCTRSCTAIWKPVPASEGAGAPSDLDLGDVDRPDGEKQLTYDGAPLYTFTEEGSGELTGDGVTDSFDGEQFTWHAATTAAGSGSSTEDGESSDSSGGGYGGY
ncbi:MAG: COG4315 family predicted lipoprotein [Solirubrobacterales bacterium]